MLAKAFNAVHGYYEPEVKWWRRDLETLADDYAKDFTLYRRNAEQEAADNCDYCRWAEKYSYRCPECDAEYNDSDQALMCASKCMEKHMIGETE